MMGTRDMSTKNKLIEILSGIDTEEARNTVAACRSPWVFRFQNEAHRIWSDHYQVSGYLDEGEAVTACLEYLWGVTGDQEFLAYKDFLVEIRNEHLGFEKTVSCYFDDTGRISMNADPRITEEISPS